jgi:4-hydroxybenzoate polyprenyltransferase
MGAGVSVIARLKTYASFVRFSHTVFALPFALVGAMLAARTHPMTLGSVGWIVAAMVTARSAAMGFNRLVDARYDALNPRTAMRELPRGAMSKPEAFTFVVVSSLAFLAVCWQLGPVCFVLAPVALAIVFWYSLAKRVTHFTQAFLGLAMAVAPVGGWIAAGGGWSPEPVLLALAIGTWVGGFDILYACQDLRFDQEHGLRSVPVRFGVPASLAISRALHVVTIGCLVSLGVIADLHGIYFGGVGLVTALLAYEQSLVSANDLSRVKQAFDLNGYVGLLFLLTTGVALYVR